MNRVLADDHDVSNSTLYHDETGVVESGLRNANNIDVLYSTVGEY